MDLSDFGLVDGQVVRFQRKPRARWEEGVVRGVNCDGSLAIYTDRGHRSVNVSRLETKRTGPKGGHRWAPVEETVRDRK